MFHVLIDTAEFLSLTFLSSDCATIQQDADTSSQYFAMMSFMESSNHLTLHQHIEALQREAKLLSSLAMVDVPLETQDPLKPALNLQTQLLGMWYDKICRSKNEPKVRACLQALLAKF